MFAAVKHDVLVDLIRQHPATARAQQRGERLEVLVRKTAAGRVVRRIDDDQPRARRQLLGHALPVRPEFRWQQRHVNAAATGQLHARLIGVVGRVKDQYFIAGADQSLNRRENGLGRAESYGHLGIGVDAQSVAALQLNRDLLAQQLEPGHRCVLVEALEHGLMNQGGQQRIDRVIRKALPEVDGAELRGAPRHDREDGRTDLRQFIRRLHARSAFGLTAPRRSHQADSAANRISRCRRRSRLCIHSAELTTPVATISTMMVASALTSGLTPRRTLEKITIGRVLEPGPATNCDMTTSSQDRVKANSQPEATAGIISGSVMRQNTLSGRAPKSIAASSRDSSKFDSRDWMITVT